MVLHYIMIMPTTLTNEANLTFDGTTAYINGALGVGTDNPTTIGLIRSNK